jgi:hypothetical protein
MCPQKLQVSPSWSMAPDFQSGQIRFTTWVRIPLPAHNARVAQLVEHDLAKVGVAGSNPVSRSKIVVM